MPMGYRHFDWHLSIRSQSPSDVAAGLSVHEKFWKRLRITLPPNLPSSNTAVTMKRKQNKSIDQIKC